jgi:predicted SprT family Zn-dependent metalloprotease
VQVDFVIPPGSMFFYDRDSDQLVILDENGQPQGRIDLPADAQQGFNSEGGYSYLVKDEKGNVYEIIKDEEGNIRTEDRVHVYENAGDDGTQPVDTAKAAEKIKDLVAILQERIRNHLKNSSSKYPKQAFENEEVLLSITHFDPMTGSGGQYRNGHLYVGTRNFKENSIDEDILATIYHEYMHYLNWKYGNRYRMKNLEKGEVYQSLVECFEKRMQTQEEFLDKAYQMDLFSIQLFQG